MSKEVYREDSIRKKRIMDYRKVFSSPVGKKVLLDMCRRFDLLRRIDPIDVDRGPQHLAYLAGTHAVLNDIIEKINKNPLEIKQEMVENDV